MYICICIPMHTETCIFAHMYTDANIQDYIYLDSICSHVCTYRHNESKNQPAIHPPLYIDL